MDADMDYTEEPPDFATPPEAGIAFTAAGLGITELMLRVDLQRVDFQRKLPTMAEL